MPEFDFQPDHTVVSFELPGKRVDSINIDKFNAEVDEALEQPGDIVSNWINSNIYLLRLSEGF